MRPHDITIVPFTITKLTFRTFMNCRKMQKLLEFLDVEFNSFSRVQTVLCDTYTCPFFKSNFDFVIYNSDEKDGLTKRYVFNGKN